MRTFIPYISQCTYTSNFAYMCIEYERPDEELQEQPAEESQLVDESGDVESRDVELGGVELGDDEQQAFPNDCPINQG